VKWDRVVPYIPIQRMALQAADAGLPLEFVEEFALLDQTIFERQARGMQHAGRTQGRSRNFAATGPSLVAGRLAEQVAWLLAHGIDETIAYEIVLFDDVRRSFESDVRAEVTRDARS
jgi:hypothetical protein